MTVLGTHHARQVSHAETAEATVRLIAEFAQLPAAMVMRCSDRAREELLKAGVRSGLAPAIEAMARSRLRTTEPPREF